MNDTSVINVETLNRDAALNTLMYLSGYYGSVDDGKSVEYIVSKAQDSLEQKIEKAIQDGCTREEIDKKYGEDIRKVKVLQGAIENDPGLGELVIANQSSNMNDPNTKQPYESGGLNACAFQDKLDNPSSVTVVFRGTGGGEWYDNGIGLSGDVVSTEQQKQAATYFDTIVKDNKWNENKPDIHVTGHSKGGNKAQFVVMTSKYSALITSAYSLDGQCMSPEAIEYMKKEYKQEYYERIQKLYSISADNDYVNILGANNDEGRIIPSDHIFFLESNLQGVGWHYPDCYLNVDGTLTDFTEQGEVSKILQGISEQLMDLPAPIRQIVTNGAMGIAELTLGNGTPVNGEKLSYAEMAAAVPMLLEMIPGGMIDYLDDKLGVDLDWLSFAVSAVNLVYYAPVNIAAYGIGATIDLAIAAKDKLVAAGKKCKELTDKFVQIIDNGIKKIKAWYKKTFNAGYKYANNNPCIQLNTYDLRAYATRLSNVNKRVKYLDERLDSLYWKVGLLDLWNLMCADILIGYNSKLSKCVTYLNDTADDYDGVERDISNAI